MPELAIAGLIPFSATDWPGQLTATVFTTGCPWACVYCHNPALQDPRGQTTSTMAEVLELAAARRRLLDGVVFSGGEPTMHRGLPDAIRAVRAAEPTFGIGLHTCGYLPERIRSLVEDPSTCPDWIGLDVKGLPDDLPEVVRCTPAGARRSWQSLDYLAGIANAGKIDLQVRTTLWHGSILEEHLPELTRRVEERGQELVVQWAHDVDTEGTYVGS